MLLVYGLIDTCPPWFIQTEVKPYYENDMCLVGHTGIRRGKHRRHTEVEATRQKDHAEGGQKDLRHRNHHFVD